MKISKQISNLILFSIAVTFLFSSYVVSRNLIKPAMFITKQQSSINLNKNVWRYFHFGQKRLFSSLLWVATILESDQEHYKARDLNSWLFLRFETISLLEPLFYQTYNFGGQYLSIIKDDIEGASILYKKGLKYYPHDYQLLKNAAFHFHFEAEDYVTSKIIFSMLKKHPSTNNFILSSLARIESQSGNHEDAFIILNEIYQQQKDKDERVAKKILEYLYDIRAEQDLECLNSKKSSLCRKLDLKGFPYLLNKKGEYFAQSNWIPYRIKRKKSSLPK